MDFLNLLNFDSGPQLIAKSFLVLGGIFYLIFSILVSKQTAVTNRILITQRHSLFTFFATLNLGASIAILILILGL